MKRSRHLARPRRAAAPAKVRREMERRFRQTRKVLQDLARKGARALGASRKAQEGLQRRVHKGAGALGKSLKTGERLERSARESETALTVLDTTHKAAVLRDRHRQTATSLREARRLLEARVKARTMELHAANKELEKEIKRRRGLEGQILEISDREQQRLGQELHDGLCQHLTAIAFMTRAVARRLKDHRVFQVEDIEKIAQLVNEAANNARDLARALHRVDVDSAGLVAALQDLVDREIWKTPCRLEIKEPFHLEDDTGAAHLYRIAREAVINANKHAQAREIVVELDQSPRGVVLSVTDDGVGMAANPDRSKGMGFHIMNDRARAARGHLEVKSRKQGGTCVVCYLPKVK